MRADRAKKRKRIKGFDLNDLKLNNENLKPGDFWLLAVVLALASSYRDKPLPDDLVAIGEVGLTGEIRSVTILPQRLAEIARLGFKQCIIPRMGTDKLDIPAGLTVYRVRNLREAMETAV